MHSIRVRRYTSADYSRICVLDTPMFPEMGGYVLFRHVAELFPALFFVAEREDTGEIVGYILGGIHLDQPDCGKLIRIGVTPGFRRMECGTRLTDALFQEMQMRGVRRVHLTVADTNIAARTFYEKIGFVEKAREEKYFYPATPRLVLVKNF